MNVNEIKISDLGKGSNIKLNVCEAEVDMYWKVAIEVLEVIEENNKKGEPTVMVVPYGPLGPYARLVYLINKYRVSLKNCVFINMDEYLTNDKKYIDKSDPLSFRGGMERIFYSHIDDELNVLPDRSSFAGSIATAATLLEKGVNHYGFSVADTVKMITETPASILKLNDRGKIKNGYRADIVMFDKELKIHKVFIGGKEYN